MPELVDIRHLGEGTASRRFHTNKQPFPFVRKALKLQGATKSLQLEVATDDDS
jgi:hypothetical protein